MLLQGFKTSRHRWSRAVLPALPLDEARGRVVARHEREGAKANPSCGCDSRCFCRQRSTWSFVCARLRASWAARAWGEMLGWSAENGTGAGEFGSQA